MDLDAIKQVAICFIYVEPTPNTQFKGLLVHHPYFNTPYLQSMDGTFTTFPYTDQAKYIKWQQALRERIENFTSVMQILMQLNSAYHMNFLRLSYQHFNNDMKELAEALRYCWTYQEFPNYTERGHALRTVKKLFRMTRKHIMEPEEQDYYNKLPDEITVYRGQSHPGKYYNALSWTDDYERAVWFANRFKQHGESGRLFKATIQKKYVYAYINERGESELVLDYTKLQDLEEIYL